MAHAISITNGVTTINFTAANGYQVWRYDLVTPEPQGGIMADDVAETMEIIISGTSGTQVQSRLGALARLLDGANRRTAWGVGPRVFLQLQVDGEASAWRAEILEGRLEPQEDMLRLWPNLSVTYNLYIHRAAAWEGALAQIPLANGGGSNNTTGLTVYLHDDGTTGVDNYVEIAADAIGGNLPTPLMLELTNSNGATVQYAQVLLANNAFSDPATLTHVLQAESILSSGGTVASDATCSGGQYVTRTFTNTDLQRYSLSSALLRDTLGYEFHLLARFRTWTAAAFVRPSIYDASGLFPLWTGEEVELPLLSPAIADLGVVPLPPGGYAPLANGMQLVLAWRAAGTVVVDTDFFTLFPANTFRRLIVRASVGNMGKIVDDGIEGRAYTVSGTAQVPAVAPQGLPLLVWPGLLQRIYLTWSLLNMSAPIGQTMTVKAWYRPRRYSV